MLEVANIHAGYGNVPVLRDVSLSVAAGEMVLIVGENGAGKSTLLRTIAGFIRPEQGTIRLEGRDVTALAAHERVQAGMRLVLDGHRVFPQLRVLDNLRLGNAFRKAGNAGFEAKLEEIFGVFPVLKEKARIYARDLSGGQQQMLALGMAFVAQPRVLLCDEPSTGLAKVLLPPILEFLKRWAASGVAIALVEQHRDMTQPYADRVVVVRRN
jgi:branched-chain amino acid transport system ATP-binding protein